MSRILVITLAVMFVGSSAWAEKSATGSANALATVQAGIAINKTQDLQFGQAVQGASAQTVAPTDTVNSAAFSVTGQASQAFNITLPANGTVIMTTTGGVTADYQIAVNAFASSPATSGTVGGGTLYVGATRAALTATQTPGAYTGQFEVTVAYP